MNSVNPRFGAYVLSSALCLVPVGRVWSQTVPAPSQTALDRDADLVVLSPFVVEATEDEGYQAKNTLAGTRVRTELKDVGSAISVVTQKYLQDTNSKSSADLLVYTPGTEVAGQGGNFAGGGDGGIIATNYNSPVTGTRVRGLAAADNLRDFFLTDIPWDSYNTGRVDLQRGPNSILFGIGSPAGIINSSINTASFKDSGKVEAQVASFGTYRLTLDINRVILKNQLAVRVATVYDDTKYKQQPAFRDDHRVFGALRFDPALFNRTSAHTSFRMNFEKGKVDGNQPRPTTPVDAITPWFNPLNKLTFDWKNNNIYTDTSAGNPAYNPWIGTAASRVFDGMVVPFPSPNSSTQGTAFPAAVFNFPDTTDATRYSPANGQYRGIVMYNTYAINAKLPGYKLSPFKPKSLTDPSIFDFYNHLIDGPNKRNSSDFRAYNLNLSQMFLNNKLGFELAYDNQKTNWGYHNFVHDGTPAITIDVVNTLMDGSPNANVGKAMLIGAGSATSGRTERGREALRGTVFGELDFNDIVERQSLAAKILGRHNFTYSQARQEATTQGSTWYNYFVGPGYAPSAGASLGQATRDVDTFSYLSGSLLGATSAAGLHLSPVGVVQVPTSTTVTQWNTDAKNYISYAVPIVNGNDPALTDATRPYTDATKHRDVIDSSTFVWQGYFFGGNLVPMVGWRRDVAESFDAGAPTKVKGIVTDFTDPQWRLPGNQADATAGRRYSIVTGQTHTWSIVAHVPDSIMKQLPGGLGLSFFYNRSENFQPDASRIDVVGNSIASPTGKTKDYGVTLRAFDDKITLKVNRYETSVANTTLSTEMGGGWAVGYIEAWGQMFAFKPGNQVWGTTSAESKYGAGNSVYWQPADAGNHVVPGDNTSPYTQAALDAQYDIQKAATSDWLKPAHAISSQMQSAWGMNDYATGGGSISNPLVRLTGDTVSKGTEFELTAAPKPWIQISVNASKTDARRLDIASTFTDWIVKRTKDFDGPMGDIRLWGGGNWVLQEGSQGTVRDFWKYTLLSGYQLAQALNNSAVPELRPWRFNGTANYAFQDGLLKGSHVGAAYRWQDKQVTGFPLNATLDGYNVSRPYYGPSDSAFDFWVGYEHALTRRIKWRIQLNVRDVFATKKLIPVTVQPAGSPAAFRIPEPRVITLTNSFEF